MDIFGSSFDDDLFESKKPTIQSVELKSSWTPHLCEPKWFMTNNTNDAGSENESIDDSSVNVLHFHASNLYHSSKFLEASDLFADLLGKVPPNNFQLRREISEGLSRSLMKSGKFSEAIEAANEYKLNSKSVPHFDTAHVLYSEIYRKSLDHEKELKHLQFMILNHKLNPMFWLRLAECYSLLNKTDLYSSAFKLSATKDSTWHASACVIRADIVLKIVKSLPGAPDNWRKKKIQKSSEVIELIVCKLPPAFVSKAHAVYFIISN